MDKKDFYQQKLSLQIEKWKLEIAELELETESAGADLKSKCGEAIDALKTFCDDNEAKLENWREASSEKWEQIEEEAEKQLNFATTAVNTAMERVKTFFGGKSD